LTFIKGHMHTAAKYIVTLLLSVSFQSVGIDGSDFFSACCIKNSTKTLLIIT